MHPDGATGTIYKAGEQVASLTTDDKGQSSVNGLYLGKYYIKEITPPTGYLADTEEHDLVCSYEGDMTAEVKRECTSSEQVIKQPFQIIKSSQQWKDRCRSVIRSWIYSLSEIFPYKESKIGRAHV